MSKPQGFRPTGSILLLLITNNHKGIVLICSGSLLVY